MIRKLLNTALLSLLLLATVWLGFRLFHRIAHPSADLSAAVPNDAALIIQLNEPLALWKQLNASSLLWSELKSVSPFRQCHRSMLMCDSLTTADNEFALNFGSQPLLISLHISGTGATDVLLVQKTPEAGEAAALAKIESILGKPTERVFKNGKIFSHTIAGETWMLCSKNGFLTLASSASLAEKVLMHLDEGKALSEMSGWQQIALTADKSSQANIFVQHGYFARLLASWSAPDQLSSLLALDPFASWTELDLSLKASTVSLNGFSQIADSLPSLLHLFADHQPQSFNAARFLPDNTAAFLWIGMNDGESFRGSVDGYRAKKGTLQNYQTLINRFNADFDCNIDRQLSSWMGNEMVIFTNGKSDSSLNENLFLVIHISDTGDPIEELNTLSQKLSNDSVKNSNETAIPMRRLLAEDLFSLLFGEAFSGIDNPWYIRVEDYMIFANSSDALNQYLRDISSDRTLGKNITYFNFVSENLSDRSNLTVYVNPSKFSGSVTHFFNPSTAEQLAGPSSLLNKFDAFAWQLSSSGKGKYYNNLYLKYSGEGKQDSKSLWEVAVDTSVLTKPFLLKNHTTGAMDVLVQDENYTIYLISSKGEITWKKAMEERIVGDVKQIDFFGNGKLQMAFTTENTLHLIDIKGNYLKGFPLALKEEISASMGVFDYESNNTYRFLIPAGKKLLNADKEGKFINGWEPETPGGIISQAPLFFRTENKDYLFVCDKQGDLRFIDRKGKIRYNLNFDISSRSQNTVILETGSTIESCSIIWSDSLGRIIRTFLNGKSDTASTGLKSRNHRFAWADANEDGKKDIILLDSNKISIYEWSGKLLGYYHFSDKLLNELMVFHKKDGSLHIGAVSPQVGEIYLLHGNGQMHNRFPLQGTSPFPIADINGDGSIEVVTGTGTRRIVCYSLK